MVVGTIPCFLLYSIWRVLLLLVSSMALCIDPVIVSAYIITLPLTFLAARPMVWIREVSDLKNPSLSASNIATKETSGISKPSLKRFIPTSTSNSPKRKSLIISTLSRVSISECRYLTFISISLKKLVKVSAIFLVRVVISTLSFLSTLFGFLLLDGQFVPLQDALLSQDLPVLWA